MAAAQAARAAAPPPVRQPRPQRTSVAVHPFEVLHQSGITMVNGTSTSSPLTAAEAQLCNDVVGESGTSVVASRFSVLRHLRSILIHIIMGSLWQRMRLFHRKRLTLVMIPRLLPGLGFGKQFPNEPQA